MIGKNNTQERFRRNATKDKRYTLKKLSVGLASVALGTVLFLNGAETVSAETEVSEPNETTDALSEVEQVTQPVQSTFQFSYVRNGGQIDGFTGDYANAHEAEKAFRHHANQHGYTLLNIRLEGNTFIADVQADNSTFQFNYLNEATGEKLDSFFGDYLNASEAEKDFRNYANEHGYTLSNVRLEGNTFTADVAVAEESQPAEATFQFIYRNKETGKKLDGFFSDYSNASEAEKDFRNYANQHGYTLSNIRKNGQTFTADVVRQEQSGTTDSDRYVEAAKQRARHLVNALDNLTAEQKAEYLAQVEAAESVAQVEAVYDEAKNVVNEVEKDYSYTLNFGDRTESATLGEFDSEEQAELALRILANEKGYKLSNLRLEGRTFIAEAKVEAEQDQSSEQTNRYLQEAKKRALGIINGLENLFDTQKPSYLERIEDADSVATVEAIVEEAQNYVNEGKGGENGQAAEDPEKPEYNPEQNLVTYDIQITDHNGKTQTQKVTFPSRELALNYISQLVRSYEKAGVALNEERSDVEGKDNTFILVFEKKQAPKVDPLQELKNAVTSDLLRKGASIELLTEIQKAPSAQVVRQLAGEFEKSKENNGAPNVAPKVDPLQELKNAVTSDLLRKGASIELLTEIQKAPSAQVVRQLAGEFEKSKENNGAPNVAPKVDPLQELKNAVTSDLLRKGASIELLTEIQKAPSAQVVRQLAGEFEKSKENNGAPNVAPKVDPLQELKNAVTSDLLRKGASIELLTEIQKAPSAQVVRQLAGEFEKSKENNGAPNVAPKVDPLQELKNAVTSDLLRKGASIELLTEIQKAPSAQVVRQLAGEFEKSKENNGAPNVAPKVDPLQELKNAVTSDLLRKGASIELLTEIQKAPSAQVVRQLAGEFEKSKENNGAPNVAPKVDPLQELKNAVTSDLLRKGASIELLTEIQKAPSAQVVRQLAGEFEKSKENNGAPNVAPKVDPLQELKNAVTSDLLRKGASIELLTEIQKAPSAQVVRQLAGEFEKSKENNGAPNVAPKVDPLQELKNAVTSDLLRKGASIELLTEIQKAPSAQVVRQLAGEFEKSKENNGAPNVAPKVDPLQELKNAVTSDLLRKGASIELLTEIQKAPSAQVVRQLAGEFEKSKENNGAPNVAPKVDPLQELKNAVTSDLLRKGASIELLTEIQKAPSAQVVRQLAGEFEKSKENNGAPNVAPKVDPLQELKNAVTSDLLRKGASIELLTEIQKAPSAQVVRQLAGEFEKSKENNGAPNVAPKVDPLQELKNAVTSDLLRKGASIELLTEIQKAPSAQVVRQLAGEFEKSKENNGAPNVAPKVDPLQELKNAVTSDLLRKGASIELLTEIQKAPSAQVVRQLAGEFEKSKENNGAPNVAPKVDPLQELKNAVTSDLLRKGASIELLTEIQKAPSAQVVRQLAGEFEKSKENNGAPNVAPKVDPLQELKNAVTSDLLRKGASIELLTEIQKAPSAQVVRQLAGEFEKSKENNGAPNVAPKVDPLQELKNAVTSDLLRKGASIELLTEIQKAPSAQVVRQLAGEFEKSKENNGAPNVAPKVDPLQELKNAVTSDLLRKGASIELLTEIQKAPSAQVVRQLAGEFEKSKENNGAPNVAPKVDPLQELKNAVTSDLLRKGASIELLTEIQKAPSAQVVRQLAGEFEKSKENNGAPNVAPKVDPLQELKNAVTSDLLRKGASIELLTEIQKAPSAQVVRQLAGEFEKSKENNGAPNVAPKVDPLQELKNAVTSDLLRKGASIELLTEIQKAPSAQVVRQLAGEFEKSKENNGAPNVAPKVDPLQELKNAVTSDLLRKGASIELLTEIQKAPSAQVVRQLAGEFEKSKENNGAPNVAPKVDPLQELKNAVTSDLLRKGASIELLTEIQKAPSAQVVRQLAGEFEKSKENNGAPNVAPKVDPLQELKNAVTSDLLRKGASIELLTEIQKAPSAQVVRQLAGEFEKSKENNGAPNVAPKVDPLQELKNAVTSDLLRKGASIELLTEIQKAPSAQVVRQLAGEFEKSKENNGAPNVAPKVDPLQELKNAVTSDLLRKGASIELLTEIQKAPSAQVVRQLAGEFEKSKENNGAPNVAPKVDPLQELKNAVTSDLLRKGASIELLTEIQKAPSAQVVRQLAGEFEKSKENNGAPNVAPKVDPLQELKNAVTSDLLRKGASIELLTEIQKAPSAQVVRQLAGEFEKSKENNGAPNVAPKVDPLQELKNAVTSDLLRKGASIELLTEIQKAPSAQVVRQLAGEFEKSKENNGAPNVAPKVDPLQELKNAVTSDLLRKGASIELLTEIQKAPSAQVVRQLAGEFEKSKENNGAPNVAPKVDPLQELKNAVTSDLLRKGASIELLTEIQKAPSAQVVRQLAGEFEKSKENNGAPNVAPKVDPLQELKNAVTSDLLRKGASIELLTEIQKAPSAQVVRQLAGEFEKSKENNGAPNVAPKVDPLQELKNAVTSDLLRKGASIELLTEIQKAPSAQVVRQLAGEFEKSKENNGAPNVAPKVDPLQELKNAVTSDLLRKGASIELLTEIQKAPSAQVVRQLAGEFEKSKENNGAPNVAPKVDPLQELKNAVTSDLLRKGASIELLTEIQKAPSAQVVRQLAGEFEKSKENNGAPNVAPKVDPLQELKNAVTSDLLRKGASIELLTEIQKAPSAQVVRQLAGEFEKSKENNGAPNVAPKVDPLQELKNAVTSDLLRKGASIELLTEIQKAPSAQVVRQLAGEFEKSKENNGAPNVAPKVDPLQELKNAVTSDLLRKGASIELLTEIQKAPSAQVVRQLAGEFEKSKENNGAPNVAPKVDPLQELKNAVTSDLLRKGASIELLTEIQKAPSAQVVRQLAGEFEKSKENNGAPNVAPKVDPLQELKNAVTSDLLRKGASIELLTEIQKAPSAQVVRQLAGEFEKSKENNGAPNVAPMI